MPQREVVNNPRLPIVSRFSQAIRVGDTLYVSGLRGIDPQTGEVIAGGIAAETRQDSLVEIEAIAVDTRNTCCFAQLQSNP
ncbi:hypothetical protein MTO96_008844 [Rhipicephalus appendiculatus]